ncbi:MAG: ABC transporter permease subunit [Phycisphaeraceae bacterium]
MTNPIIQRELVGVLRQRRALLLLVALIAALTLLVILRWPSEGRVSMSFIESQQVLRVFGYGMMVGLILLAPAFPATSIVREKRTGTLALLLNSPMSPASILLGKIMGVAGFVLLLLVVSMPAAAACYAMGGIDLWADLVPLYAILILLALQYATLGLLVSSFAGSADTALRATFGFVLIMSVVAIVPFYFLRGLSDLPILPQGMLTLRLDGPLGTVLDWLRCVSPIPAMMETLGQGDVGGRGFISSDTVAWRYGLLAVLSIIIFAGWTILRLGGWMLDRPRAAGKVTQERSGGQRVYRGIMYMYFFDPQKRTGLIGPLTNPVMVKEFRSRRFGRSNWMMRLLAGVMLISLLLAYLSTLTSGGRSAQQESVASLGAIIVILQMALIVLLTPSLASGLIAAERESGGWELLQLTPLSSLSIMVGKLMSVAWTVLLILLATLPGYAVLILIDPSQKPQVMRVLVSLALTAAFALLLSAAVSSLFRRTAVATAVAYTLVVGLCAGTMLFWLGQGAPFSAVTVEWVLRFNPLAGALELIQAPGFTDYHLVPFNWWFMAIACGVCLLVLLVQTWRLTRPS